MTREDFPQPRDFRDESDALYGLLAERPDSVLSLETQFKAWSIEDVIAHLHLSDRAAELSLREPDHMRELFAAYGRSAASGRATREATYAQLDGLRGRELLEAWHRGAHRLAESFEGIDPRQRLPWAGPDMSARSSISARLMETWAHGQAIYDRLGVVRVDTDRIYNIAVLGVITFAWTFRNRGLAAPGTCPRVRLQGPSGVWWEWNEAVDSDLVEGSATAFCQVVTQTRSLADTSLRSEGPIATRWMSIAQCFAGPPQDPPKPGTRYVVAPGSDWSTA